MSAVFALNPLFLWPTDEEPDHRCSLRPVPGHADGGGGGLFLWDRADGVWGDGQNQTDSVRGTDHVWGQILQKKTRGSLVFRICYYLCRSLSVMAYFYYPGI